MPDEIAYRKGFGMALTMCVRTLKIDNIKNNTPAQNTAPRAVCQATFIPLTTVKVKKALSPIPGATSRGFLAYKPIIKLQKKDKRTVAVRTAPKGKPAWLKMAGFTTIMYIVAKKDDTPAMISVRREVW